MGPALLTTWCHSIPTPSGGLSCTVFFAIRDAMIHTVTLGCIKATWHDATSQEQGLADGLSLSKNLFMCWQFGIQIPKDMSFVWAAQIEGSSFWRFSSCGSYHLTSTLRTPTFGSGRLHWISKSTSRCPHAGVKLESEGWHGSTAYPDLQSTKEKGAYTLFVGIKATLQVQVVLWQEQKALVMSPVSPLASTPKTGCSVLQAADGTGPGQGLGCEGKFSIRSPQHPRRSNYPNTEGLGPENYT